MDSLNQKLARTPHSSLDRLRLRMGHHAANKRFEEARRIHPKPLEDPFPQLGQTRCTVQTAVRSSTKFVNIPIHELVILSTVCATLQPQVLFEFGTYDGLTTLHLAMNSPETARIYTIDLHIDDPIRKQGAEDTYLTGGIAVGGQFHGTPEARKIEQIYGDSTQYDPQALKSAVDFIFVDAGHAYDLVRSDSQKALEMIRPGGVLFWHDYNHMHPGVYTWLNELSASISLAQAPGTSLVYYVPR